MNDERKIVLWGAGKTAVHLLQSGFESMVCFLVDNDMKKDGTQIMGLPIRHPSGVADWKQYFVIIASIYEEEISRQLEGYGLKKNTDFISYSEYDNRDLPLAVVQEALAETLFASRKDREKEQRMTGMDQYLAWKQSWSAPLQYEKGLSHIYRRMPGKRGGYIGFCAACEAQRTFQVDYMWSTGDQPAWRETLTCPTCHCNSRMRFVIDYMKRQDREKTLFLYEYVTQTYRELKKYFPNITGSEYLGDTFQSGQVVDGILHQDAMQLSFADETFDFIVSNDVFEHVADAAAALREAWRCLKDNGHILVSIPVFKDREQSVRRTVMGEEGKVIHLLPPVYHGNPLSTDGALVFTDFGWDFIKEMKAAGFRDAWAIAYFSAEKGYFGEIPVVFEGVK